MIENLIIHHYIDAMRKATDLWIVYMLKCKDESFYTGITNNLQARLKKHNEGKGAKYTRGRGPFELLKYWEFSTKSSAAKEEYRIKQLTKKQKNQLLKAKS